MQNFIEEITKQINEAHRQIPGPKFIAEYRVLVDKMFCGGFDKTFRNITAGDGSAIELALVYIEIRPYFFRSQYIRTRLIRKPNSLTLSPLQTARLKQVLNSDHERRMKRKALK